MAIDSSLTSLSAISPLDGRYAVKVAALREHVSEYGLIRARVVVEVDWVVALCHSGALPELTCPPAAALAEFTRIKDDFDLVAAERVKAIEARTNHDVKAVEYLLAECIENHPELGHLRPYLHFGCTSEDVNNLAYALICRQSVQEVLLPAFEQVLETLKGLARTHAADPMLARTHGQPASPTTMGKELACFAIRLAEQMAALRSQRYPGKFNGAVGNFNAHLAANPDADWPALSEQFVTGLGLHWNPVTTQIEPHDGIAELLDRLRRIHAILIDLSRDIWGYVALGYFRQRAVADEVGSSTMPHKVNPIDFENAEGNLGVAAALAGHLADKLPVSRWQRDLSDSTVLRNLGVVFGHTLLALDSLAKGLARLETDTARMRADLDDAWEVLAEAVQTVLRRHGVADAYERLKALTRGQALDRDGLHAFIRELAIPESERERLLALTPADYVGNAAEQVALYLDRIG